MKQHKSFYNFYYFHCNHLCTCINAVPTTPITTVCAVYDTLNRTLQNIESMWKKLVSLKQSVSPLVNWKTGIRTY